MVVEMVGLMVVESADGTVALKAALSVAQLVVWKELSMAAA